MVRMSQIERKLSAEGQRLNDMAGSILIAMDEIADWSELLERLAGTRWVLGEDHRGAELFMNEHGWVVQVYVEIGVAVAVKRWSEELGWIIPGRKDRFESAISVYPRYEASNPIFDDLRLCGLSSKMGFPEATGILAELKGILAHEFQL